MSETQQGPDWWLAADGKWYPPQQATAPAPPPPPMAGAYGSTQAQPQDAAQPIADAKTPLIVLLAGAAAVILGAFLAWATIDFLGVSESKAGTDGDGVITVVFGVVIAVLGALSLGAGRKRWQATTALVLAVLVVAIAVLDMADIKSKFSDSSGFDVDVKIGIGLWLTLAGGLAAAVGSILALTKTPKSATAT